jgi:hypothetical protein
MVPERVANQMMRMVMGTATRRKMVFGVRCFSRVEMLTCGLGVCPRRLKAFLSAEWDLARTRYHPGIGSFVHIELDAGSKRADIWQYMPPGSAAREDGSARK